MTDALVSKSRKRWLPAEPGIANLELSQELTARFLQPSLPEIEAFLLAMRRLVDADLSKRSPQKYGKPYPLSQCLEISKAMQTLVDPHSPSNPLISLS